jgi:ribonucleotide monophosphatase NagD (HAD superfamily)
MRYLNIIQRKKGNLTEDRNILHSVTILIIHSSPFNFKTPSFTSDKFEILKLNSTPYLSFVKNYPKKKPDILEQHMSSKDDNKAKSYESHESFNEAMNDVRPSKSILTNSSTSSSSFNSASSYSLSNINHAVKVMIVKLLQGLKTQ